MRGAVGHGAARWKSDRMVKIWRGSARVVGAGASGGDIWAKMKGAGTGRGRGPWCIKRIDGRAGCEFPFGSCGVVLAAGYGGRDTRKIPGGGSG